MGHQTGVWWQFAGLVFTNIAQIVGSRLGMLRLHPRSGDIAILVLIVSAVVLAATPMPAVRILAFFVFSWRADVRGEHDLQQLAREH